MMMELFVLGVRELWCSSTVPISSSMFFLNISLFDLSVSWDLLDGNTKKGRKQR
ncbi:hypothetical protein ERO13_A10G027601v2 [Gossypium hirsutum]|nr:hypothetical protein ERO13_A10G027601v2 [Gossypium hirsutum]